ncbi:LRR receptor-like serine/threonine-protein kinase IOS1 [Hevea brasiliensis]|uniref:LRR receptor-like serine/threonine-protein kinase IOS1 n=1 Tax=Hevea brasiliensis TaxID=3981 RepID=UPI0025FFE87D|nr:LRR receptor-like serine/threonine-protein kinase IOS1 [Hevea brasiliensis]
MVRTIGCSSCSNCNACFDGNGISELLAVLPARTAMPALTVTAFQYQCLHVLPMQEEALGRNACLEILFLFLVFVALAICVQGQDQSAFISLDCGLPPNTSYSDANTSLNYISDASFIDSGESKSLAPEFSTNSIDRPLWYVRSFPLGSRNCYDLTLTGATKYLIRATFMYGNYDNLNQLPVFDLHIGPNKWVTVKILNASIPVSEELIYDPPLKYLYICLVNTNSQTPFISALELRPLKNTTYVTQSAGALALFIARLDIGSITNQKVRYPDDVYDRLWYPYHLIQFTDISTNLSVDLGSNSNDYHPPSIVMRSASTPANSSIPLNISVTGGEVEYNNYQFYLYMHFAEVVKHEANQSREFNISLQNGTIWYGPVTPLYLYSLTVYSMLALPGEIASFFLSKVGGSTLPPLLNALEAYYVVDLLLSETSQADVDAIVNIKSRYGITSNWQGDPCSPQDYVWDGLNCSYNGTAPPIITSLNLSSSGLTWEIPPDIANLKSLKSLDLSNNSLTGPVPDFLSQMLSLKVLNLTGNRLTGTIPVGLLIRSQSGLLLLSVSGNPELCASVSCNDNNNKKKHVVPVAVSVAALFVIIVAALAIWRWSLKRRKKQEAQTRRTSEALESRKLKRQFAYFEVLEITNNFGSVLGRGGFGTVYHGYLDDIEVAVKTLSPSSVQGYKEFQAEVKLLLRVHHKNLTSLVGYCEEANNMVLIYEYMANGNLKHHLSGDQPDILSWEGRLRVALEAAQGLEYLHNGCKPPIVHRDVKTTNILLDAKFQAKLSDFGLSRIFPNEDDSHVTTTIAGTPGYLDPDYNITTWLTEKSDVYSFGVVLLEIITSRPVIAKNDDADKIHLSNWVSSMLDMGDIKAIADPRLHGDFDVNSLWKVTELAMACVSETSSERPNMTQVVMELKECLATEMARTREGSSPQSNNAINLMALNLHSEISPLAR